MAAAAPSPLASSVEKTNGAKLSRLLIDGGTTVLRRVFDYYHPPANLSAGLNASYTILDNLLYEGILNRSQWDKLFPPSYSGATPDSNTFDISLLFLLLTNICGLSPPRGGWHREPYHRDTSYEANLARIKFFGKELYGHVTTTCIDAPTFTALWQEISAVLVALGLHQAEIDRLKAERCGEGDYIDVLLKWADREEDINSQLKDIRQYQSRVQQSIDEVHQTQLEDHETLQDSKAKLKNFFDMACLEEVRNILAGPLGIRQSAIPLCLPNNLSWDSQTGIDGDIDVDMDRWPAIYVVEEALEQLREVTGPVCVVSIAGPYRKGKSYILSEAFDQPDVFPLGHEWEPKTKGVWLWVIPEKYKDSTGQVFTVVLLDTGGINADLWTELNFLDIRSSILTVLLSSVLIYNSAGVPTRSDFEGMDWFVKISEKIQMRSNTEELSPQEEERSLHKTFPYFIWLLRDVVTHPPADCASFKDYFLKKVFAKRRNSSNRNAEILLRCFPGFDAYSMPVPTVDSGDINPEFRDAVIQFKHLMRTTLKPAEHIFNDGELVTGEGLAALVQVYVAMLNSPAGIVNVELAWEKAQQIMQSRPSNVPLEILARGPLALKAYNKALTEGKACIKRVPIMLIGQDRAGKTSLKKSLKGETFIKGEESTDGIEKDPSYFKVSTEVWKTGEKNKETESQSQMSFECFAAAQLICGSLRKENSTSLDVEESTVAFKLPEETSTNSSEPSVADLNLAFEISEEPSTSGADFVTKETTRDTELSPPVHFKEKSDTRLFVPELPEDIAALVEKWLQNGEKVEDIYSILWDFGGESVYYATHPIFLTEKAIYILVSDLSRNPYEQAKPHVRKGMYTNHVDTSCSKTNLDYLDFWMSSVYSLVSPDVICQDTAVHVPVTSPRRLPPVFLVCTHADEPYRCSANTRDLALEVYGFLRTKTYREHLFKDVFVVDNTKSGSENECPEVMRLRDEVLAVAKELPQMKEAIPLKWLKYEKVLQVRKERDKWIPLDEARQIASDDCRIDDDKEFSTLLDFLHDQRIVIHFNGGSPELEKMVILDPQWLIDVFKKVITVQRYEHTEENVEELWRKLEKEAILDEILLNHAWSSLFDSQETCKSLTAIMERLSLLCPWPSSDSSKQYLVPSMLMSPPTDEFLELLASVKIPSLFVKFESGRVPPGLFSRLIVLFFQWCNEEWNSQMNPQLFHNFAMFHIRPEQGSSVIFLCHSSSIEIIVHNGNDDLETKACFSHGDRDVTYSRVIHFHLGLMLECMRKEFSWLKNMKYEMCVCCPVCSLPDSVKCRDHDVRGCECLHFLSESELRKSKYCNKRRGIRGDRRIPVAQFAPWFAFPDEHEIKTSPNQQATLRHDKSSSSAKEGETLALALPDGVMQSIHCQTSDPKEIVVQLQESLQLDSGFLENPEPKTKQWIRCLAIEAKAENRTDMVEYLRQITPAGTAGPLLNEDLDVRHIPIPQRQDLTFSLSGGDEWKLLAERLGLSQIVIRFLDKRVLDPCDVVLGHVGNHRFLSVGELYDMLVDCELPAIADLM